MWYTLDLDWVVVLQDGKTSVGGYWFCGLVVGKCCFSNNLAGNVLHVEPIRKQDKSKRNKEEEPHYYIIHAANATATVTVTKTS